MTDSIDNEMTSKEIGDVLIALGLLVVIISAFIPPSNYDMAIRFSLVGIALILTAIALYNR
ncbi:MAG: hypothetical protein ACTSUB_05355 [Candidatus Thorarchaeota archaeon]